jgi:hypothetical protein
MFGRKFLIFIFFSTFLLGQKNVENQQLLWYGYYNKLQINQNWVLNSEVQERHFYQPLVQHQLVFRTNLDRRILDDINVSLGFVVFLQSPNDPESESTLMVPELRTDFGFNAKKKYKYFNVNQRFKVEARFFHQTENNELVGGYQFSNFRMRYQLGLDIPLIKKQDAEKLILKIKDEVMFNFGKNIVKNVFDQNRIYIGLNYPMNKNLAFEAGYLNWFQQRPSGTDFYNRDIIRFSVFHTINLKK